RGGGQNGARPPVRPAAPPPGGRRPLDRAVPPVLGSAVRRSGRLSRPAKRTGLSRMATRQEQQSSVTLRLRRSFPAPRERVFRAWTTPAEMKLWKAPGDMTTPLAEVDLRPGGKYRIHMRAPDGA